MLIGVTGSIGAGKSCVATQLGRLLKAKTICADQICRELLKRDRQGYLEVVRYWLQRFLDVDGNIDRSLLRDTLFRDDKIRLRLEAILHPLVRARLQDAKHSAARTGFVVAEVPLLFESGWQDDFDWIVAVYAPAEVSLLRVPERDGTSIDEVRNILAVQMSPEEKRDRADSVIDNSADWAGTEKQIRMLAVYLREEPWLK